MTRLPDFLYDDKFAQSLDGPTTYSLLQFACGTVLDMETGLTSHGMPELLISKHVGWSYPSDELSSLPDLRDLFRRVRAAETLGDIEKYSPALTADLTAAFSGDGHEIMRLVHDAMTPTSVDGEKHGGWPVTIFRAAKMPAAALTTQHESFGNDEGSGGNGKGFLWAVSEHCWGGYAATLSTSLLSKPPPDAAAPSPELWALRGCRFLGTPEVETDLKIRPAMVKCLSDKSTTWCARGLYEDSKPIKIPALFMVSTNTRMEFTGLDGGIRRRAIGCGWPVNFVDVVDPENPFHRPKVHDNIKDACWYTATRRACYLHTVMAAYQVFFVEAGGTRLARRPQAIKLATEALMQTEFTEMADNFVETECHACAYSEAVTMMVFKLKLQAHFKQANGDLDARTLEKHLNAAIQSAVVLKNQMGRKNLVFHLATSKFVALN